MLREYFPEITAALLNQNWQYDDPKHKVYQYITSYVIKDEKSVLAFLKEQDDFMQTVRGENQINILSGRAMAKTIMIQKVHYR